MTEEKWVLVDRTEEGQTRCREVETRKLTVLCCKPFVPFESNSEIAQRIVIGEIMEQDLISIVCRENDIYLFHDIMDKTGLIEILFILSVTNESDIQWIEEDGMVRSEYKKDTFYSWMRVLQYIISDKAQYWYYEEIEKSILLMERKMLLLFVDGVITKEELKSRLCLIEYEYGNMQVARTEGRVM